MFYTFFCVSFSFCKKIKLCIFFENDPYTGAAPEIFQRGAEEENFERKMFVDTRINATKTRQ